MSDYDTNEWITPCELIGKIEETVNDQLMLGVAGAGKYKMNFDLAATPENAKCARFWTREDDALIQDWRQLKKLVGKKAHGVFPWLNPPYGRRPGLDKFADKIEDSLDCFDLLPVLANQDSTTDWHKTLWNLSSEVWRLSHRLHFGHPNIEGTSAKKAQDLFWIPRGGCSDQSLTRLWNPRTGEFL